VGNTCEMFACMFERTRETILSRACNCRVNAFPCV
jgi:hypothetical protein